MMISKVEMGR